MSSVTDWTHIEPRTRDEEMVDGLAARIHDPLWLLARQWQLGELLGEDSGSPVSVRAHLDQTPLSRFHPGPLPRHGAVGILFDARRLPLEALVEREAVSHEPEGGAAQRFAVDAGQHFLRLLEQHGQEKYRHAYVDRYAMDPPDKKNNTAALDPSALRFLHLMAGRVPDGLALRAELEGALHPVGGGGALPEMPQIADSDRPAVNPGSESFSLLVRWFFYRTGRITPAGVDG